MKIIGIMLLFIGAIATASAAVPEIDANSSVSALTLLSGALLLIQSRRKK
jgi:hypothetical protein